MYDIEYRMGPNLLLYAVIHSRYFENLEKHGPKEDRFIKIVHALLPDHWALGRQVGGWRHALPPQWEMASQGFKIHLSTSPDNSEETLRRVIPIFARRLTAFKFLANSFWVDFVNSQNFPKTSSGKFITAYPKDIPSFRAIIDELDQSVRDFNGPYILTDRPYNGSKVVFYRHGAFQPLMRLGVNGHKTPHVKNPDGAWEPEIRQPFFTLPEHVEDPFGPPPELPREVSLNNRYQVLEVLASSSKGGVYLCHDLEANDKVVIKEARPFINQTADYPHDAVAALQNERQALELLSETGVAPRPLDYFTDWDHHFLAMEYIEGTPLSSLRAFEDFSVMLMTDIGEPELKKYCRQFLAIAEILIQGLAKIHKRGLIVMDLAPQNVIASLDFSKAVFIDFETSFLIGKSDRSSPIATIGFVSENRKKNNRPCFADDYFALRNLLENLLFPAQLFFSLNPNARRPFLEALCREKGIPLALLDFLDEIPHGPERATTSLAKVKAALTSPVFPKPDPPDTDSRSLETDVAQISANILNTADLSRGDRVFPGDYRVFQTNPLSLAYGAMGILFFLKNAGATIPQDLARDITARCARIELEDYPPGLWIGSAGVAWALDALGYPTDALYLMEKTYQSPLLEDNADLFHGAAGWGLASLYFHRRTGDGSFMKQALRAASCVAATLQTDSGGLYYRNMTGDVYHSLAYGAAGIALFFLRLFQATGEAEHLAIAKKLLEYEIQHGVDEKGALKWPRSRKRTDVYSPYWATGNAGVSLALLRFYQALGEDRYLALARRSARYLEGKFSIAPGFFSGMAGIGSFFLEIHRCTGETAYLDEAFRFARRTRLYRIEEPEGVAFPGEDLLRICHDFATGSAGIGFFYQQLLNREEPIDVFGV